VALAYNYSLYFLQFLTDSGNLQLCYIFIPILVGPLNKLTLTERSFLWLVPCLPFPGLLHIYFLFTVWLENFSCFYVIFW
jgi:hypothetical protein